MLSIWSGPKFCHVGMGSSKTEETRQVGMDRHNDSLMAKDSETSSEHTCIYKALPFHPFPTMFSSPIKENNI